MESYIRPGCVVLSVYVSMPAAAWEQVSVLLHFAFVTSPLCNIELTIFRACLNFQLEGNLLRYVNCLLQDSDSDFWRKARFLVHAGNRQLASHKDGKY